MTNPVTAWHDANMRAIAPAVQATGQRIRADVRPRIDSRTAASGKAQKANTPATSAAKRRRVGRDIPLNAQGILSDPDRYTLSPSDGGLTCTISPPTERRNQIPHLRAKGYEVFEMPAEAKVWLEEELAARLPK